MTLYNTSVFFYGFSIRLASLFNEKAAKWIKGRQNWRDQLSKDRAPYDFWFHVASLGEFEQARPLIEALKAENESCRIVLTFFSPSGFEIRKNYPLANKVMYLPLDLPHNAADFIELVQPKKVVFVKYEFWLNYLNELEKKRIPTILISAIFREGQVFFKSYGKSFRKALKSFEYIYVQDENSKMLLEGIEVQSKVVGDTRIDRVKAVRSQKIDFGSALESFTSERQVVLFGSAWEDELKIAQELLQENSDVQLIVAPHLVDEKHLTEMEERLGTKRCIRFTKIESDPIDSKRVVLIDTIGQLSKLYKYGTVAVVGGGFQGSVHNTLEPSVWGIPVLFGPDHEKFEEAKQLVARGASLTAKNWKTLSAKLQELLEDKQRIVQLGELTKEYIELNSGATQKILSDWRR